jgi:hypothetical protein
MNKIINKNLQDNAHLILTFPKIEHLETKVKNEDWPAVDKIISLALAPKAGLWNYLQSFGTFKNTEFIIAIRDGANEDEEDGIWHDDGSRNFAFSLSLTLNEKSIEGGNLGLRKKGEANFNLIPTPSFGDGIIFLTGVHGYEHKIHQVIKGRRIIIAGWLS